MNLPARMSWRYLFARKSTNAINIITLIAAFGVAIGVAALILVLSVFNGFEDMFLGMFNNLNPDVRVTARRGKTFRVDEATLLALDNLPGVKVVSGVLEETAIFRYGDRQSVGSIKGVDHRYREINQVDTMIREGAFDLDNPSSTSYGAVVGTGLGQELGVDLMNEFMSLTIYMAKPRARGGSLLGGGQSPFRIRNVQPTGIITSQEEGENRAVIISLALARELLSMPDSSLSALEIGLFPGFDTEDTYAAIGRLVGEEFTVSNRYQQENALLKIMQIEKWLAYAIVSLMMILISFNLIGALWMIVLEKRKDITILRSLGMTATNIRNLFLRVGLLICGLGLGAGFLLAFLLRFVQRRYELFTIPGTLFEAFPISFRLIDFPIVALTVLSIGLLASLLPARRAERITAVISEE